MRAYARSLGLHLLDIPIVGSLLFLTALLVLVACRSLAWVVHWDATHFQHMAYLINEKGLVPYQDIFDPNMPGALLFHVVLGKLLGYGDLAYRIFDLLWLAALSGCTWKLLRAFDWRAAWLGVVAFGLHYLLRGEKQNLQRDYLIILPLAAAVLLASTSSFCATWPKLRLCGMGALFGAAATIKPQALVGLPVVLWMDAVLAARPLFTLQPAHARDTGTGLGVAPDPQRAVAGRTFREGLLDAAARGTLAAAGLCVPVLLCLAWLWAAGGLGAFHRMATQYWPIFTSMHFAETIKPLEGQELWGYLWICARTFWNFCGSEWLCVPALLVVGQAVLGKTYSDARKKITLGWCLLVLAYYGAVVLVGQFHPYSWMPMLYFLILLAAPCLFQASRVARSGMELLMLLAVFPCLLFSLEYLPKSYLDQLQGKDQRLSWGERPQEIAEFLRAHARPGDQVQPLDWLGGTSRALLLAEAEPATPLLEDLFLYVRVKEPFVKNLRQEFLCRLDARPPRFIVHVLERNRLSAGDPEDTLEFQNKLTAFVKDRYDPVRVGVGYIIYERKIMAAP